LYDLADDSVLGEEEFAELPGDLALAELAVLVEQERGADQHEPEDHREPEHVADHAQAVSVINGAEQLVGDGVVLDLLGGVPLEQHPQPWVAAVEKVA